MSTAFATIAALVVLASAGAVPVFGAVGPRWVAVPLAPLAGSVLAGVAATASLTFGGDLLSWLVGLAVAAAAVVFGIWIQWPEHGPFGPAMGRWPGRARFRLAGVAGFLAVVMACAWSLRGLRTPTVGFDARALWVMRPGWFLHSHAQMLVDLRTRGLVLTQSAYPPLVSASAAVAWKVTGVHTARLGVTVIAVLNGCALAAAALAVLECGRGAALRLATVGGPEVDPGTGPEATPGTTAEAPAVAPAEAPAVAPRWTPVVAGVVAGVLLVVVSAGVCEPFLTNGYADPLWSLAAVGAVAWGLQSRSDRSNRAVAGVLILVAGLSKNEGLVVALALVALVAARSIGTDGVRGGWRRWRVPVAVAALEVAVLAWWPLAMHVIGARGASSTFTTSNGTGGRASAVVHGMSPYLHVLVLAAPLAALGGLVLAGLRRRAGMGNDLWAWLALAVGLVAVGGALVTGAGAIVPWIRSTVHRITEYPILQGWWIVGIWAVVASCGLGDRRAPAVGPGLDGPVLDEAAPGPEWSHAETGAVR